MLFGRLRILGKLTLLVLVPLVGVVALAVPIVLNRIDVANRAQETADAVLLAERMGSVLQEMQEERLYSVGYLLGLVDRSKLSVQSSEVDDGLADVLAAEDIPVPAEVAAAAAGAAGLADLRASVLARTARPDEIVNGFAAVVDPIIASLDLIRHADLATATGRQVVALDSVLRNDERINRVASLLAISVGTGNPIFTTLAFQTLNEVSTELGRFGLYATEEQAALYVQVQQAFSARVGQDFFEVFLVDPARAVATLSLPTLYPSLESVTVLGRFVQKKIATEVDAAVITDRDRATRTAYLVVVGAVLLLLVVIGLSTLIGRAVAQPLRRLTGSAERIARAAEDELRRVADDESEAVRPVRLDPVDVQARDEIGDLARAFDRVQNTAVGLVERQVASRRNVAQMFGHVGRRTQNLVGRQLALIDRLEREETDADRLRELYRLDHMSSRLRRNASSLVVLSGAGGTDDHTAPMPLADVVRLALGEIEDYTRVDVEVPADIVVVPAVVGDLTLLLAELMENATAFSPPHTRVTVTGLVAPDGARLSVIDRGLGLPPERIEEENARLTRRERLDLVPTEVLGLFVVGRLARRHGFGVVLSTTPGGGLTANVELSARHLPAIRTDTGVPAMAPADLPALPASGGPGPSRPNGSDGGSAGAGVERRAAPFDPAALTRASRTLERAASWNAFVPRQQSPAVEWPLATPANPPATPAPSTAAVPLPAAPPAPPAQRKPPEPPAQPATGAAPTPPQELTGGRSGLRRRVPGSHLPEETGQHRTLAAPTAPADATAARDLVEAFEAGVSRAEREAGERTAGADAGAEAGQADRNGLTRRVPGATLPEVPPQRSAPAGPEKQLDPDEARDLIEQFETGVALALRAVPPHQEGQPR